MNFRFQDNMNVVATADEAAKVREGMVIVLSSLLPEEGWRRFADGVVGATGS